MNDDKPKSIWKKSWRSQWLILLVPGAALFITLVTLLVMDKGRINEDWVIVLAVAGCCVAGVLLALFVRWLCCWKNFRRFLFVCACLATLIAFFYAEENWRGKHDWDQFKRRWEAKGEKFAFKDFIPPPVPEDRNFAFSPAWIAEIRFGFDPKIAESWYGDRIYSKEVTRLFPLVPVSVSGLTGTNWWPAQSHLPAIPEQSANWAMAQTVDLKSWQAYYRKVEKETAAAEIPIAPRPQSPAADVLLALSKFDPVVNELRRDSARPYSRFPIQYNIDDPAAILLPHLAALKQVAQVLQLRSVAELQNGQSGKALACAKFMLYLVNSIRNEPFPISQLVRIVMLQITLQPIYEGLAEHKWSDAQLAELDLELAKFNFLDDYEFAMRGERACSIAEINSMLRRWRLPMNAGVPLAEMLIEMNGGMQGWQKAILLARFSVMPRGWLYQNELAIGRIYQQRLLPMINSKQQTISPELTRQAEKFLKSGRVTARNVFVHFLVPALVPAAAKFAYAQESVDLARVAIALERYRLAHEEYPESLDSLAPQFIPKLPHDIINGQPLHYHRTSDGQFVLYSVGWNETNDGGAVVFYKNSPRVDISKGDWVWRYPAK